MYTSLDKYMEVIYFIRDNWQYISTIIVIIITIIGFFVKKFKFDIKFPANSYHQLIQLVKDAESVYGSGHGSEKLNFVIESFMRDNNIKYFGSEVKYFVENLVEEILSTPEKKGVSDEKVK